MFSVDENEIAWVTQNRLLVRFVAIASAVLFASYAAVDWMLAPEVLEVTGPWRLIGVGTSLLAVPFLGSERLQAWSARVLALVGVVISVVVSIIFLGIVRDVNIAITAQMQVLMAMAVCATVRTAVRATLPVMLLSFNLGLWWNGAGWQVIALCNWLLLGAFAILLVVSETAYRTFVAKRRLEAERQQLATIVQFSDDAIIGTTLEGIVTSWNAGAERLFGYSTGEMIGRSLLTLFPPDRKTEEQVILDKIAQGETVNHFETVRVCKDASLKDVSVSISPMRDEHGRVIGASKIVRDISERKRVEELTWHQANFDSLTNLPNRALLFDRLSKECSLARRNTREVAVLFIDLDRFKLVNDHHGHDAGDRVLQEVARRWLACVREADTVARLGGDEFAVVLGGLQSQDAVAGMAEKLIAAMAPPFQLPQGASCRVGASIGISIYPTDATEVDTLITLADTAMYDSKARGKNTYTFCRDAPTVQRNKATLGKPVGEI